MSWEHSVSDDSTAVKVAASGDEVRIAQGTYTSTTAEVVLITNKALILYGGFNGTDWTTSVATNTTIIDAQNARRGIYLNNAIGLFDSLTIQNGNTTTLGSHQNGGGISLDSNGGTLALYLFNSTIKNNISNGSGGGVSVFGGKLIAVDSQFLNNTASEDGGGVAGISQFDGVLFKGNVATRNGGGAILAHTIQNSSFINNTAKQGAGGGASNNGDTIVENSLFRNNVASASGGLAQISGTDYTTSIRNSLFEGNIAKMQPGDDTMRSESNGAIGVEGNLVLDSVIIRNNIANKSNGGIGQWWMTRGVTITNSLIEGNKALDGNGGAGTIGGRLTLSNSLIYNNSASVDGGGFYQFEQSNGRSGTAPIDIRYTSIISNTATTGNGGGLYTNEDTTLTDTTIAYNYAGQSGAGLYMSNYDVFFVPHTLNVNHSHFIANTAHNNGGAMAVLANSLIVKETQILANQASNTGGGMYSSSINAMIQGTVFGNNQAGNQADGLYISGGFGPSGTYQFINVTVAHSTLAPHSAIEFVNSDGTLTLNNTLVTSHTVGLKLANAVPVNGDYNNFFANTIHYQVGTTATALPWAHTFNLAPAFVDPVNNNFHLQDTSPLINIGDPTLDYTGMRDIDRQSIPLQTRADIGGDKFFLVTDRVYLPLLMR